ncbi:ligand-binding sensor domain-containing protein [Gracilimonas mengyeensis]|uniref:histidine kinase n=1 Tax=Gracilimonas mengyeensis TaxID=1302730 RepID=A0A521FNE4_9BACT|nr:two-component regulator propeller domain-containing protein [Gracilimonas mengyeensis]SMO97090.1 ligand-binding sensor domain-containing protein [Gracilimonas mengyeensis]
MGSKFNFIILFALLGLPLNAQNLLLPEFRYLTPDDGLSQSTVETIYQDHEGFMWFGTLEGLNKYEGQNKNIVVYKHDQDDPKTLSSNEIEFVYEDSKNNLWIGTDWGGLNLYDRDKDHFRRITAAEDRHVGRLSDNTVHNMLEDSKGNIWVGTYKGLNLMNRKDYSFLNYFSEPGDSSSLSGNYITDIFEDSNNQIWVGTNDGLNRMHKDSVSFDRFYLPEENHRQSGTYVNVVYEDSRHNLWIGTESGLYVFDREVEEFRVPDLEPIIPESAAIMTILEDSDGVCWIGTENDGLFAIPPGSRSPFHYKYSEAKLNGINSNSIYSLYESRDKILWIGTFDGGLNILNRKQNKFKHYKNRPGTKGTLNENSIISFLKPDGESLWIGTDGGGINLFKPKTEKFSYIRKEESNPNSLSSDVIFDMIEDRRGIIWIATYNGGLVRYDRESSDFKTYLHDPEDPQSLSHNQVFAVMEDSDGYIWAGTNGNGLSKLVDEDRGVFESWNPQSDSLYFPLYYIRDIFEDQQGFIWVTTYGGGVVNFQPKSGLLKRYNMQEGSMSSSVVLDIYESSNGTIWAGTKGGGLDRYNPEKDLFESYTTADGLPNDIINSIIEDENGNLWLSTNNGLSRFNPVTGTFKNYNVSDGLQSREFKPRAAYKMEDGTIYFGGINGFNSFHPDSISENSKVSNIALTDFLLNNKSVKIGGNSPLKKHINQVKEIVLPHSASIISFKYSALNFNPDLGYTYAYKLEGFDQEWNEVGNQNTAIYTNLDPGEYIFMVKTANSDNIWGEEIKQVQLVITPPFWRTYWFYGIVGILSVGLIFGGVRYRTRRMASINKMLEQQVAKRTSELEESNKDLKKAMEALQETKEELVLNAHKAGMADIATGVLHNIGNVLNSVTTSTTLTSDLLRSSKLKKLFRANALLEQHSDNLEEFLLHNPKGQKLMEYYLKLDSNLKEEYQLLTEHNKRLEKKVILINDIIGAQQSYARAGANEELADLSVVIDDAMTIYSTSMDRHGINIEKNIEPVERAVIQKTKLVHVIVNLLKNAKDALLESNFAQKKISIRLYQKADKIFIEIADNGPGIKNEDLKKIFTHGFTTKKKGHGFGLHSSANYMTEMGGKLTVSNNDKRGAVFTLIFPSASSRKSKTIGNTKEEA